MSKPIIQLNEESVKSELKEGSFLKTVKGVENSIKM